MRKRLGQDADEVAASSSQMHPEDELYAVPSDLQVRAVKQAQTAFNPAAVCPVAASQLSPCRHVADVVSSVWWVGKYIDNATYCALDSHAALPKPHCMHGATSSCSMLFFLL